MGESSSKSKRLGPVGLLAGIALLLVVMIGCGLLGIVVSGGPRNQPNAPIGIFAIVFVILGVFLLFVGAAAYGLVLLTRCFTFRFERPFLPTMKGKMWLSNLIVGLLIQSGFAFIVAPGIYNLVTYALPSQIALIVSYFGPFMMAQFVFIWFTMWAPLETMLIARRLAALGVPPDTFASGQYVGTSDPGKSSFKKLTLVEDDMGMLWIEANSLVYRGDSTSWVIRHDQLLEVERVADAGSVAAYFGGVHVILRLRDDGGVEHRLRIHAEGTWTQTARARKMDYIGDRLEAWREHPTAGWPTQQASGFLVSQHQ